MRTIRAVFCLLAFCAAAHSQTILAVDFNRRNSSEAADTFPGFQSFVINSNGSATANQTTPTTRTFGSFAVTVGNSGTPAYVDRLRGGPANTGAFTESLLLRDFVFSLDNSGTSGLDLTISGLDPNTSYRFIIWSFDASSSGNRVSDWSANSVVVTNGYAFNGGIAPTSDTQYRFSFTATTTPAGTMTISGRRNTASVGPTGAADVGVFLNAFRIETDTVQPPIITIDPVNVTLFAGDNATFTVGNGGTAPFTYIWLKDDTNVVPGAATSFLVVSNAQLADAGLYSLIVSNSAGSVTSAPALLTVTAVSKINDGLLAYWPLDSIVDFGDGRIFTSGPTLDSFLWATNMVPSNIVAGVSGRGIGSALFNGVDEFLSRTNGPQQQLPASQYPAYSVTLWVKGSSVGQVDRRVFSEGANTNNNALLTIGTDSRSDASQTNVVDILVRNNDGSAPVSHRRSSLPAFDGNWHHIAWVDNNGFAQLYVDGIQDVNNFNYTRGLLTPNIASLGAVVRTNAVAFFNGQIDDVVVYRRSLTSNEVNYVMTYGPFVVFGMFTHISIAASNVTLQYVDPTGTREYRIEEATVLLEPAAPTVWTEVTNVVRNVDGNRVTAEFPQSPGPQRFYRLISP